MTTPSAPAAKPKPAPRPPHYADFTRFAEEWLFPLISVRLAEAGREQTYTWCPQWWRHRAVAVRIAHLHRAFEASRRSGSATAFSSFVLGHVDPHMKAILDAANGPLHRCTRTRHVALPSLTAEPVPPGWFRSTKPPSPQADTGKTPRIVPRYAHWPEFVTDWLLPVTAVRIAANQREGSYTWCRKWWAHHAVSVRFAALHVVFEAAHRADDHQAMSSLFIQHIDPHMRIVLEAAQGPLHRCTPQQHTPHPGLAARAVPGNWFGLPGTTSAVAELGFGPDFRRFPSTGMTG